MDTIGFVVKYYLIALSFISIACILGLITLRNFDFNNILEKFFFSTVLGTGLLALLIFFLGILGILYKEIVYLILVLISLFILIRKQLVNSFIDLLRFHKDDLLDIVSILVLLILVYPIFISFLYPPINWDATSFHLSICKQYITAHKLVFTEYVRFPVFNQFTDMLFTGMLLVADDLAAQSVSWISNILLIIGIFSLCKRFFNRNVGILSVAFWLSAPLVICLTSIAYIDLNLTMLTFAAIYAGFIYLFGERKKNWLHLSSVLFGFSISSKYSAMIVVCLFCILIVFSNFDRKTIKPLIKRVLYFGLTSLLISSPWFIRNYYYTGNPLFPFMKNLFGVGKVWNAMDYEGQMADLIASHGLEKNIINLLDLPHSLSFHQGLFLLEAPFTPIFFGGVIMLLIAPKKTKIVYSAIFLWVTYLIIWFYSAQIPRYLLIVWPVACITFGWAMDILLEKILKKKILRKKILKVTLSWCITTMLTFSLPLTFLKQEISVRGQLPISSEQRTSYITRFFANIPSLYIFESRKTWATICAKRRKYELFL